MSLAEICHCGHAKETHHVHKGKVLTCLGSRCDCEVYTHREDPLPAKPLVRPANPRTHPTWCLCTLCSIRRWP
jgi:hypothetical protein